MRGFAASAGLQRLELAAAPPDGPARHIGTAVKSLAEKSDLKGVIVPILRLVRTPASQEMYEAAIAKMQLHTRHPLGLIMHGASCVDGETQIAQVWESEEYADRFEREILGPALDVVAPDHRNEVTILELHDLVTP
jgi:hypothetical protein